MKFKDLYIRTKILIGFSIVLGLFVILSVGVIISKTNSINTFHWVNHTNEVIAKANLLVKTLVDMETGQRGFLIAGEDEFLEPYTSGKKEFDKIVNELKQTVSDNPVQVKRLENLFEMKEGWLSKVAEFEIQFRRDVNSGKRDMDELIALTKEASGKKLMDDMRGLITEFTDMEEKLNVVRNSEADSASSFLLTFTVVATLLALILGVIIAFYIADLISKPIKLVAERAEQLQVVFTNLGSGLESMAQGDLSTEVHKNVKQLELSQKDEIGLMTGSINQMITKASGGIDAYENVRVIFNNVIAESENLINDAKNGLLDNRGNADKFDGVFKDLVNGINETLDAVIKPVAEGREVLEIYANGDLTKRVEGDYKGDHQAIKNSINKVGESIGGLINKVSEAVMATSSASSEISSSTEQMAAGAQEQSAQSSEVATAVEQMTNTIVETAQNANNAAHASKEAKNESVAGVKKVEITKSGMDQIVASTGKTGAIIKNLTGKTEQIGEIAQVIDDIADQTNLLALNAAIEAARAGEQGRGFAVVADEVRKLAERTTTATKEIAETIKTIQIDVNEADESMDYADKAVQEGLELTEQFVVTFNSIVGSVERVSMEIDQVASASEEQSATAEQVSKNIEGINNVTNESAAAVQQIANTAEDLNRLTVNLTSLIDQFKVRA